MISIIIINDISVTCIILSHLNFYFHISFVFQHQTKEDPNWCDQRAALKELYAPRPVFLNLLPPFNVQKKIEKEESQSDKPEGQSSPGQEEEEEEEEGSGNLSSSSLHLVVLQVELLSSLFFLLLFFISFLFAVSFVRFFVYLLFH